MMRAAGERPQHAFGVGSIDRLLERMAVDLDGGVGAKDERRRVKRVNHLGFFEREALHISSWVLQRAPCLINVRRHDLECEAGLREELAPAWRGGGEDQPHQASASTEIV